MIDIEVLFSNDTFVIESIIDNKPKIRFDIIDALNEFFLYFSYRIVSKTKFKYRLIHCSAFQENNKNTIIIGEKRAGKSQLVLNKAQSDTLILADDLILWNTEKSNFVALGLPIRLRKTPHNLRQIEKLKSSFLIGKYIMYSHNSLFNIAQLGEAFLLDKVSRLNTDHKLKKVSIFSSTKVIKTGLINKNLSTKKVCK